jgi:acyl-CoA synthetase (AMP-forming)/AMP-acid ligase II
MPSPILSLLSQPQLREFYSHGSWQADTIYGRVRRHAESTPEKVAVREGARAVTYGALVEAADRLAAHLHGAGVRGGQRVAVWLPSRAETAVALLSCSRNGYVCCPSLHRGHTVDEITRLVERMQAAALISEVGYGVDAERRDITEETAGLGSLRFRLRLPPVSAPAATLLVPELAPIASSEPVRNDPDSVVYLAFTSGTTGQPKGVMHSDNTLLAPVRALSADWSLDRGMVVYSLSPLSHNLGFGAMVLALAGGGELVVHDLPRGGSLVDRLVETGASFLFGVPTHAIDLLAELKQRGLGRIGDVRGFRVSGAPVPSTVVRGLLGCGVVPQSGYGMTEAGSHHYTMPDDPPELIASTSGRAYAGYAAKIFSREDPELELPPGEVGQVCGRGASLMLGYFDDQGATEASFNAAGWFMTGDLGWVDENGYLRITGRKKDIIIRGGHNIFPAHIEDLALNHPAVDKAAVIPVADERLGEKVCLAVTFKPGESVHVDDLLAHLDAAGLSKLDMPEYFLQLEQMPLGPSGKILKRELVEAGQNGQLSPLPVRFTRPPGVSPGSGLRGGA